MSKVSLLEICNITTGKLDSNAATSNGIYPFFTCAPEPLKIDEYDFDDDVILLAGNNASGNFHCQRFKGKFNAYQRTYIITAKKGYNIDFIYYNLKLNLERLKKISQGSQTKFITMKILEDFVVDDISYEQQLKISSVLTSLDKKIKINNDINTKLEELLNLIYNQWFLQFDFINDKGKRYKSSGGKMIWNEKIKKEIPEGWLIKELKDIESNIVTGKTPSTKESGNFNGEIPFITIEDIRKNKFIINTERTLSNSGANSQVSKYIPVNSICVSCIATIGLVGITTKKSQTNQQINSIVCNNRYNMYYLFNYISNYFKFSNGAKTGNIFANMNRDDFSKIEILYPDLTVLKNYCDKVNSLYEIIKNNTLENDKLSKLRDFLLPLLINGQAFFI